MSTCLCLFLYLPLCRMPIGVSVCLHVCLHTYVCVLPGPSLCLYVCMSTCLPTYVCMLPCLSLSVCLSAYIRLYASLSVCMSTCLLANVRMCTCQSSCLSSYLTERLFACLSYRVYVCLHTITLSSQTHSLIFGFLLIPCVGSPAR